MEWRPLGYRDKLARDLRRVPDKERREDMLQNAKLSERYIGSHSRHSLDRLEHRREKDLQHAIESVRSLAEMKATIERIPLFIRNPVHGIDHSEHLAKRIEMADRFSTPYLLPEKGGLRGKAQTLLRSEGRRTNRTVDTTSYRQYLKEWTAGYALSEEELVIAAGKIPPDTFGSIDGPLENAVILLNSIPGVQTRFSCAGHMDYAEEGIDDSSVRDAYFVFSTRDEKLVEKFKSLPYPLEPGNNSDYVIRFSKSPPPEEWLHEHGKRTREQIFEDCKKEIAAILGHEILSYDQRQFWDNIFELQRKYIAIHPEAANIPYATNSKLLEPIARLLPEEAEAREYRDWYTSPEAEQQRINFLNQLTAAIDEYRDERKK
ncbi:MAG: hypothetical protein ACREGH_01735 [Minisyncoccia bacterium]